MWPFSSHRFSSLKGRLVFSALLPGLAAATLLAALSGWIISAQLQRQQEASWQASLAFLTALAGQRPVAEWQALADLGLTLPHIRSVIFRDPQQMALARAGAIPVDEEPLPPQPQGQALVFDHGDHVRQVWPIIASGTRTPLGWIDVELSTQAQQILLYRNLAWLGLILLVVTCLAAVLASLLFHRTTSGFRMIQQQLDHVSRGNFEVKIPLHDNEELNTLIDTLNRTIVTFATHQRELQEHINQSTQDLRETLETVEIQNIELDLARKEALNASKIKSEFLANTSHEIRTPLNGIIGFTRLLLRNCQDAQQREYLTTIQQSSENLLNLINDILDLSKIEAGKLVLEYESFNIHQTTEETLQILAPSAHEKGLELAHWIDPQMPDYFFGDASRLKQILTNLIGNAIKFSNSGNILVRISFEHGNHNQALLKCSVSDTGIGISRSQLNKDLFSAFSQSGGNSPQQRSGAGLGLAISKKLVAQMGGDIGIDSEENVGSTFWFTLKLDIDQQRSQDSASQKPSLQGKQFLLFDSNTASRQSLINLLTGWGARFSLTQDYTDVLPALTANSNLPATEWFSATIISIPVDNQGFSMERLGELVSSAHKYGPVIINTPSTLRYYLEKILPIHTTYISKPVTQGKWIQTLQACQIIASHTAPRAVASTAHVAPGQTRLLVVDDQPANLLLLSHLLRDMGYPVEEASSGRDALALCQQYAFDCIFMDIRMPDMDGVETTQRIRMLDNNNRNTPVIAVTAQAMADQKQHLLLAGLDDYLSKPIQENLLTQVVTRWLHKTAPTPDSAAPNDHTVDSCVDIALCLKLSHAKPALAADMLGLLLQELPTVRREINLAFEENRWSDARELIHKLHGACCYCGVPALHAICKKIERQLNERLQSPPDADRLAFDQAVDALLHWEAQYDVRELFA